MIEKLLEYIKGFVIIKVSGNNLERFINICNHNNIKMYDITYIENIIKLRLVTRDFKKIKSIASKTNVRIRIVDKYGLPFFAFKNRKRKMFFAGIISALVVVYIMSLHIWQISVEGNYTHTDDELLDSLSELGVVYGLKKSKCDTNTIEKAIRNEYKDIKWASVEILGTRLIVHVKENYNEIEISENIDNYNIYANKSGKIISIVTGKGTPLVKAGDEVCKGDILIGGYYDIMSDFGELIETKSIKAEGTIIANTVYEINENIERNYEKKVYTGNTSKEYEIGIFDKSFVIDCFGKNYDVFDSTKETSQIVINENFYLPIYYKKNIKREYEYQNCYYSNDESYEIGQKIIDDFLEKLIEKGIQITQNNVTIEVNDKNIIVSGEIICYENIGIKEID